MNYHEHDPKCLTGTSWLLMDSPEADEHDPKCLTGTSWLLMDSPEADKCYCPDMIGCVHMCIFSFKSKWPLDESKRWLHKGKNYFTGFVLSRNEALVCVFKTSAVTLHTWLRTCLHILSLTWGGAATSICRHFFCENKWPELTLSKSFWLPPRVLVCLEVRS
jgi:hypothetical protein